MHVTLRILAVCIVATCLAYPRAPRAVPTAAAPQGAVNRIAQR
jgi:uncharacterized membrane protein